MERDYGRELDELKNQMKLILNYIKPDLPKEDDTKESSSLADGSILKVYYSGEMETDQQKYHGLAREKSLPSILAGESEDMARILSSLGHKQRLEIIKALLVQPRHGTELVELLGMGTTGQLYHHLKPLIGAGLVLQEERGGSYSIPRKRALPLLLVLSGVMEMFDTSRYIKMRDVRERAADYTGKDIGMGPGALILAVLHNSVEEHKAGHCSKALIILQADGSATISDDGRGIPVEVMSDGPHSALEEVLTDLNLRFTDYKAPGAAAEMEIGIVNALSKSLTAVISRGGYQYRQYFRNGIPQSGPSIIGETKSTGTSITIVPNSELIKGTFNAKLLKEAITSIHEAYPGFNITLLDHRTDDEGGQI
ncbi:ArsR family transcriptional regulator [Peribacillus sp. SCS-37]|uniref:ArsR family transcriptional regulator n=1 Tax=Paraperibacillus esterisolvens TaxID=3115296 RepID=UPI003905D600